MPTRTRDTVLHGHAVRFWEYVPESLTDESEKDGPLVLIHGIAGSKQTWKPLLEELDRRRFPRRVLAPDMLGHGDSATPRADYGLGAFASGVRDLLLVEGHEHATIVGHSLGGGVALQFAYQFPQMCDRLVLVDSGGLGPEVSPLLRATALPGTRLFLAATVNPVTLALSRALAGAARKLGGRLSPETRELTFHLGSLAHRGRRTAFVTTARGLIDLRGQRAGALDRLYLADTIPMMLVWGEHDQLIPVRHGQQVATLIPGSRWEVFEKVKHFPHVADPERFAEILDSFLAETSPARLKIQDLVARLVVDRPPNEHAA